MLDSDQYENISSLIQINMKIVSRSSQNRLKIVSRSFQDRLKIVSMFILKNYKINFIYLIIVEFNILFNIFYIITSVFN